MISDLEDAPVPPFRLVDDDRVVSIARDLTVREAALSPPR
jgi:hypothetical protein